MNKPRLSPANVVILAAGAVMLIGSFLGFYTAFGQSINAWSRGLFGIVTVVVGCGVAMAGQVALTTYATNVTLSPKPFGLTWDQVHLALGFQAMIMMLGFLVQDNGVAAFGIGFWLMLASAIALFVGAIMRTRRGGLRAI